MTDSAVAIEVSSGNGLVGLARLYRMPMAEGCGQYKSSCHLSPSKFRLRKEAPRSTGAQGAGEAS